MVWLQVPVVTKVYNTIVSGGLWYRSQRLLKLKYTCPIDFKHCACCSEQNGNLTFSMFPFVSSCSHWWMSSFSLVPWPLWWGTGPSLGCTPTTSSQPSFWKWQAHHWHRWCPKKRPWPVHSDQLIRCVFAEPIEMQCISHQSTMGLLTELWVLWSRYLGHVRIGVPSSGSISILSDCKHWEHVWLVQFPKPKSDMPVSWREWLK